jgi:isoleucyl-tRNA synthetase
MFNSIDTKESFPNREKKILQFWQEKNVFAKSLENRKGKPFFSFYDGPPFATGLPHYGHLLVSTIKDIVLRYKTMKGFYVPRRFGWDCHGLPVENEIEKTKNLSGAPAIEEFGIGNFNEECRSIVLRYSKEWETMIERMGRWVDFSHTYRTMDISFMESVWWVFGQLYKKGLIYEGFKVMPYSAKLGTPLSNFEAQENYKEVDDPSLVVAFQLLDEENTFLLVWTTTPWTLVSNLAITAAEEIDYVKIKEKKSGRFYILAKERLGQYFNEDETEIVAHIEGKKLEGRPYKPLFPHFEKLRGEGAFHIILDGFVTLDEGTGLVHTAPGFGEADFFACKKRNLPLVCPVDANGQFTDEVPEYKGRFVKDCDKEIIRTLKGAGCVFRHETCRHRYPFCWRSDTPLIYKAVATWFVAVEKIKDKLLQSNDTINWVPEHIKYGRFGNWLENARDWAISRNRYWGTPIPIWQSEDGDTIVISSVKELEERTGEKIHDLHRHFIDYLTFEEGGKLYRRIPEVFDCWFESGSMPYAQNHYPFENKEFVEKTFPADFIAEALDQTRGWFYTLTVLSSALFDKAAFKNVVVNGIILAEDGAKMSKRLRNYPDPEEVINQYGADAVRLYMIDSPAVKADDLCFSKAGVEGILRQALLPLWNAYSFFITYARLYGWKPEGKRECAAALDRWCLSSLNKMISEVDSALSHYDLNGAVRPCIECIDKLTNWYIRRSRRRFWSDEATCDRDDAFYTLYSALITIAKVMAPFVPFLTEAMWVNLRGEKDPESIHLCDFPEQGERDRDLEESMRLVQEAVSLGHSLRKDKGMKVRQPLAKAFVVSADKRALELLEKDKALIMDELNVQDVEFSSDESQFVSLLAKPNWRVLGKKIGKLMKAANSAIENFGVQELTSLSKGIPVTIVLEGQEVMLTPEDVAIERKPKGDIVATTSEILTVALDTHLTPALIRQGIAREIVNKVNTMRKEEEYDISDRIRLKIQAPKEVEEALREHEEYVAGEILSLAITFGECQGAEWDINGMRVIIAMNKATL